MVAFLQYLGSKGYAKKPHSIYQDRLTMQQTSPKIIGNICLSSHKKVRNSSLNYKWNMGTERHEFIARNHSIQQNHEV